MKKFTLLFILVLILYVGNSGLSAQSLYGSDATAFTWNTTSSNKVWGTVTGGPYTVSAWPTAGGVTAVFEGTAGAVPVGAAVSATGLTFSKTGYTLSSTGTVTLTGATPIIAMNTSAQTLTINAPMSATGVVTINQSPTTGGGTLNFGANTNAFSGGMKINQVLRLNGNCTTGGSSFGVSGSAGTITFASGTTGSSITNANTAGTNTNVVYNPIVLNSGGSLPYYITLGATKGGTGLIYTINYNGAISGASDVYLGNGNSGAGGAGATMFSNNGNTYTGKTIFNPSTAGYFQCGVANCFPTTTQLVFGAGTVAGTSPYGTLDLNGYSQTVGSLESNLGTFTGPQTITNTSATPATITISGGGTSNTAATYAGSIGAESYSTLTTTNNDISLVMNSSGATETFTGANTFTGGLTVTAGSVIAGVANAFAATVPVTLNGGTFSSGATTGYTQSVGTLSLSANSTLALGTGSHSVTFSGVGTFTTGNTLTITGWTGAAGASGTGGRVYIGGGQILTAGQLAQIVFSGYTPNSAIQLTSGEIVPLSASLIASLSPVSPASGSEAAGTTYTITVSTSANTTVSSTVSYTITGIQASQIASGSLTGTITIPAGSNSGSASITMQNDNIYEGTETGTVSISSPTGSIATASSSTVTFTLSDDAIFYWNGGTPTNNPATGGTGTWSTASAWVAPVNTGTGTHQSWVDGYEAYLGGTAGKVSLSTSPSPSGISVNTSGYIITPSSSTAETLAGNITLAANDTLILNDPALTGTAAGSLRTLNYTGASISGSTGSAIEVAGGQGSSTSVYSNVVIAGNSGCNISVPVIMNGTGTGYVVLDYNLGSGTSSTLSGGVQIANTNTAAVVLGSTAGYTMTVNGITASASNLSPVIVSNHPAGSGKGTFIFEGTSNYYGPTYLATNTGGIVQCSGNNSLSPNSVITFGTSATADQGPDLDLNGTSQTIAGLAVVNSGTGEIENTASSTPATLTISQPAGTANTFGLPVINGTGSSTTALTLGAAGSGSSLTLTSTSNTFTGGLTLNANGNLITGATNTLPATLPVTMNGGQLSTAATVGATGLSQGTSGAPLGTLAVTANSTIQLGSGSHALYFADSHAVSWTGGTTLTITGWQGINGSSGVAGQIFVGNSAGGLTAAQLAQINFSGYGVATQLSTGEVVPLLSLLTATLSPVSPATGSEAAGTTYTITVTTTSAVSINSTVAYTITGIQASQLAAGSSLTGTISITAGSNIGTATFTVQTDNIIEGTETGVVAISAPTGGIGAVTTATETFTLYDNVTFFWNGGTTANNPATGGTGTWSATNAWIAPVDNGTGSHDTWTNGYNASLGATAGTITLTGNETPLGIIDNVTGYIITPGSSTAETLGGTITLANNVNLTLNDPAQTGTAATSARTLNLSGSSIIGGTGSSITIGGGQGASTAVYSNVALTGTTGCSISVPVIMNGTGAGGYVALNYNAGTTGYTSTLSGGVQIANTNNATVVLGGTSGYTMEVNGITAAPANLSPVMISNHPSGSGKGTFIFEGTSNYYGPTYLSTNTGGIVQCSGSNSLSPNTVITFGSPSTAGQGPNLDLAGTDQQIAGLTNLAGATGEVTNSATSGIATLTVNQNTNKTYGLAIIDGGTGAKTALTKAGTGILTLTGANTFTGGLNLNAGTLLMGAANVLASAVPVTFDGGTFSTGATTGYGQNVGTLNVAASSTINLGTGSHTLKFSDSHALSWTAGQTLTITGWQGLPGSSGTAGQVYVGSDNNGLTAAQLDAITFAGYGASGAIQLTSGEIVPAVAVYTWTGATNTSWSTVTNWSPTAPASGPHNCAADVIIPVTANSPVLASAVSVRDITIQDDAQLTLDGDLTLCGNVTGGTTDPANILGTAHLVLAATGTSQTIRGHFNINYLEINNTYGGVISLATIAINNGLIMTNGSLNNNSGNITLVSNASGDAYLDNFTSATAGTFSGAITVQRYISDTADGYRDIASSVGTSIANLNSAYPVTGQNNVACYYAYSPYPNLQKFDESFVIPAANGSFNEHWLSYTALSDPMPPMMGLAFRTYAGAPFTIDLTGEPFNGTISAAITNTTTVAPANDGWNLLGNPYPSPISWSAVKALNAAVAGGSYYVYNATGEYTGNWGSYNGTTGVNGATNNIATSQGFFIQTTAPSSTFTMNNTVRTTNSGLYYAPAPVRLDNELRLVLSNAVNSDEIVTYTDANATNGYDMALDAVKMPAGSTVNISYSLGGYDYAINVMHSINEQTILPLTIEVNETGTYTLSATLLNTPGLNAMLFDAQANTFTDLSAGPVQLALTGGQQYTGRYSVVFKAANASGIATIGGSSTHIYSFGNTVYVERSSSSSATISIMNVIGQNVADFNSVSTSNAYQLDAAQPWYAIVKVTEGEKVTVAKVLISNN